MPEESFGERTEAPTPKRRQDARQKGNVAKSIEINSVFVLLATVIMLRVLAPYYFRQFEKIIYGFYNFSAYKDMNADDFRILFNTAVIEFFKDVLPVIGVIMIAGVLANIAQVGFILTAEPLKPSLEKINPLSGIKRMFSLRSVVEAIKSILKFLLVAFVAYLVIKKHFSTILILGDASINVIFITLLKVGFEILWKVTLVLLIIAILDYAYQRYEHENKLKMTLQEIKEERKQLEGDPQIKARIRSLQREMARRRMMSEVPKATVVITNPTTLAIAIQYEKEKMDAPVVVAKGKLKVAEKIKEIAKNNDIPIVEDKPLARAMYNVVEIGDPIPVEFYTAVAEILAYVFKLQGKAA